MAEVLSLYLIVLLLILRLRLPLLVSKPQALSRLLSAAASFSTFAALVLLVITRITVVFSFVGAIASTRRHDSSCVGALCFWCSVVGGVSVRGEIF